MRPFLRWAGSKRQLLSTLATYWTTSLRYVEPFAGSAALFFHLGPSSAVLGDTNRELIHTFRMVQRFAGRIATTVHRWPRTKEVYYQLRSLQPADLTPTIRAARFIYLNRHCFNGLYRTNQAGAFNVPYGGDKAGALPGVDELKECGRALRAARLLAGDFRQTLQETRAGDFVYMDPPYRTAGRQYYGEYGPEQFSDIDVTHLRSWMEILDNRGIQFVVSYSESDLGRSLAKGFHVSVMEVRRNIAGFAGRRRIARELLISNIG